MQATYIRIGDSNSNCGNITNSYNITGSFNRTIYKSDEDAQILSWLSPLEPNIRHQGVRSERCDGVGDWLLETNEFREWRSSEGEANLAVLFCLGNPGVGKTYLSSLVIDSLCNRELWEGAAVAALYCDFLAQQEQTPTTILGAIMKQLVVRGDIPEYLREAFYEKMKADSKELRLPDLIKMLRIAIASLPQVFICIDGLDELLPKHLPTLLQSLRDIVWWSPSTRIFLTGRPHVREDIQRNFTNVVVIPITPNMDDIRSYLEMRLDQDADPEAMDDDLRADIVRITMERISDMFLLVSLYIDAILGEVTVRQRRKKLQEITRGDELSGAYSATLTRLKAQKGNKSMLGMKVLMWVLYSERPLRAEELCHALGVEVGSTDLDVENAPTLRSLVACCLGLVTVEESSSTVRLVHFTLRGHLLSDPTHFHSPHSEIAEVCLTYLNFGYVRDLRPTPFSSPATTPLLEYASCYWGTHARRGMTENVKILSLKLLTGFDQHISSQILLSHYDKGDRRPCEPRFDQVRGPEGFTGLHAAAYLGIAEVVAALLEMKEWDLNAVDTMGNTALLWAVRGGHKEITKIMLTNANVNPNLANVNGQTPFWFAAETGTEDIVMMLLERGCAYADTADLSGRTSFSWLAGNGCERAVKVLLERKLVNPDPADSCGRTPLSWAAGNGCEGVVKAVLEREDVSPDPADSCGRTPLSWAAGNGCEGIVKALLERTDVNPDPADSCGRTPLSWAAGNGCETIVKALLERTDVNPDLADSSSRTPLLWAASRRHERVVKLLLERRYLAPTTPTHTTRFALRIAIDTCFLITIFFFLFLSYLIVS